MKKIILSAIALVFSVHTFAQYSSGGFELDKSNLYYGVRLGITSASISGDIPDFGAKTGMTLAGVVGMRVSSTTPLFLESGLYYTQQGGKDSPRVINYNGFEIPILIKYGIKATDDIALLPFVGPYFGYAFNISYKKFEATDTKYDLNRAHMGFKLGCGAEYNKLYLEVGYQFGVSNVYDHKDETAHANALFANFGINF